MQRRTSAESVSTDRLNEIAVAAARAGVPVEVRHAKKPPPVDRWVRVAQVLLAVAAIVAFWFFVVFAIGDYVPRGWIGDHGIRQSSTEATTSMTAGKAGRQVTTTVTIKKGAKPPFTRITKTVTNPTTTKTVVKWSRPSDTIVGLMGTIAFALLLVAATLPRLRSFELGQVKIGLADTPATQEAGVKAASRVAEKVAQEPAVGPDEAATRALWSSTAVANAMAEARAKQFDALLTGAETAEVQLTDDEIDGIVDRSRPRS